MRRYFINTGTYIYAADNQFWDQNAFASKYMYFVNDQ